MRTLSFVFLTLATLASPAHAETRECGVDVKAYAKQEVKNLFAELRALGWNNLLGIRETEVLAGFQKIQKVEVFPTRFAATTGSRQFALWSAFPGRPHFIQINCHSWKTLKKVDAPYLISHEVWACWVITMILIPIPPGRSL